MNIINNESSHAQYSLLPCRSSLGEIVFQNLTGVQICGVILDPRGPVDHPCPACSSLRLLWYFYKNNKMLSVTKRWMFFIITTIRLY